MRSRSPSTTRPSATPSSPRRSPADRWPTRSSSPRSRRGRRSEAARVLGSLFLVSAVVLVVAHGPGLPHAWRRSHARVADRPTTALAVREAGLVTAAADGTLEALTERATALLDASAAARRERLRRHARGPSADPWAARIHRPSQRALRRLAVTPGVRVVLFSGRTAADLAGRTRIGGVTYLGDHGVERADVPRGFRPASMRIATTPAASAEERAWRGPSPSRCRATCPSPGSSSSASRRPSPSTSGAAPDVDERRAAGARLDRPPRPDGALLERHAGTARDRAAPADRVHEGDRADRADR